jgi:hypothetical protein
MSRIREYRTARRSLEVAAANLIAYALNYNTAAEAWRTRELLEHGREYGRALARVERMRTVK